MATKSFHHYVFLCPKNGHSWQRRETAGESSKFGPENESAIPNILKLQVFFLFRIVDFSL